MIAIEFIDKLSSELEEKMEKGLLQYESSHGIDVNFKRFSFFVKFYDDKA